LVTLGLATIRSGGSFTLISGPINDKPILGISSAVMVNGVLQGFVKVAAMELLAKGGGCGSISSAPALLNRHGLMLMRYFLV